MSTNRHLHHRLVVGYHGCDRSVAEPVLLGREKLQPSTNAYDWLGEGVYFWEHSQKRALEFAQEKMLRQPGKIREPFVLGAYINLGRCFDLTDTASTSKLTEFYNDYVETMTELGAPLADNRSPPADTTDDDLLLRELDCAVLNLGLKGIDGTMAGGAFYYQTVRGVFVEGKPAYPKARIYTKTHIQIAVRDSSCILGFFMPSGYTEDEASE